MSPDDVFPDEMRTHRSFDDHTVEELVAGRCPDDRDELEALAALTRGMRAAYRNGPPPRMRGQLTAFVESPLTDKGEQPATAGSKAHGPGLVAQASGLPKLRETTRRKTAAMLTALGTFLTTLTGKAVLGATVAAAAAGGLHAADVVDVPVLPDRASEAVEEHETDSGDIGTAGHVDGGEGHGPSDDTDPGDFGSDVSTDAQDDGVDGATVADEADDFGTSTATKNADGTAGADNVPDDPTSGATTGSETSETGTSTAEDPPEDGDDAQDTFRP